MFSSKGKARGKFIKYKIKSKAKAKAKATLINFNKFD